MNWVERIGEKQWLGIFLALLCLPVSVVASAVDAIAPVQETSEAAAAATGTGEWQSRERGTATLPWQVEIEKFGDGAVQGWLRVLGSDYGKVQLVGRVDGNDVYGELLDAGGAQVGTFQGAVAGAGAAGTYSMNNGDDGNWTWPGVKAAEALTAGE